MMAEAMTEGRDIRTLVESARRGDRDAFDALVAAHETRLRRAIAKKLRRGASSLEADEIVQETIVRALESLPRFEWQGEGSFYAWLSAISRHVVLKLAKRMERDHALELPDGVPGREISPSRALLRDERFDRLERALSTLPPDYREVLRLSRIERLKVKEIARRMDRTEYAVKHLIARAIRRLRTTFGDTDSLRLPDRRLRMEGEDRVE